MDPKSPARYADPKNDPRSKGHIERIVNAASAWLAEMNGGPAPFSYNVRTGMATDGRMMVVSVTVGIVPRREARLILPGVQSSGKFSA